MEKRRLKTGSCLAAGRVQSQVRKEGWIVERNKIALVQCGDVAWGGQGPALGRAVVSDEVRKEGQVQHWGRGCRPVRYWRRKREESCCCSCTCHIWLFAYH